MRSYLVAIGVLAAAAQLAEAGVQKEMCTGGPSAFEGTNVTIDGYLVFPTEEGRDFRVKKFNSEDSYIMKLQPDQVAFAQDCKGEPVKIVGTYRDGGVIEPTTLCHWYLDDTAWKMVCECNRYRAAHRLPPLQPSRGLLRTAFTHSYNMRHRYGFRHGGTSGWSGENIAMGQPNVSSVTNQWYNSSGHRANMLNPNFRYIGVGHYNGMWTQQFR